MRCKHAMDRNVLIRVFVHVSNLKTEVINSFRIICTILKQFRVGNDVGIVFVTKLL